MLASKIQLMIVKKPVLRRRKILSFKTERQGLPSVNDMERYMN